MRAKRRARPWWSRRARRRDRRRKEEEVTGKDRFDFLFECRRWLGLLVIDSKKRRGHSKINLKTCLRLARFECSCAAPSHVTYLLKQKPVKTARRVDKESAFGHFFSSSSMKSKVGNTFWGLVNRSPCFLASSIGGQRVDQRDSTRAIAACS